MTMISSTRVKPPREGEGAGTEAGAARMFDQTEVKKVDIL
jgi:hypothetical protein